MKNAIERSYDEAAGIDPDSEKDEEVLLEMENRLLEDKLGLSAFCSYFAKDMPPPSLNRFLRHLLFIEDIGPRRTIRSLFPPDFVFPPLEKMGEMELEHKIESIKSILMDHGILLELSPALPPDLTYAYIVEEMLPESVHRDIPEGSAVHFTGCGGWCPECFQKEYCETRKEEWPETQSSGNSP